MKVPHAGASDQRRGIILIVVLISVALLSLSAYTYFYWVSVEAEATFLASKQVQTRYLAESGVALVETLAKLRILGREVPALGDNPDIFHGIAIEPIEGTNSSDNTNISRFTILSGLPPVSDANTPTQGNESIRLGVEREASRLHLHHWFYTDIVALESTLLEFPGSSRELVDAVLDWIDGDGDKRQEGAEREYYEECDPPILPRNGPIESIEELLLVKGMTPEILFGEDSNRNGRLDANENDGDASPPRDNEDGKLDLGWAQRLTLYSGEPNLDAEGKGRIDLNKGELGFLFGAVRKEFGEPWARFIIAGRVLGLPDLPRNFDEFAPAPFFYRSAWDLVDGRVAGVFDNRAVTLASPLASLHEDYDKLLPRVLDRFTTRWEPWIGGRVDVTSAPPEVLKILAGLSDEERERLVKDRPPVDIPTDDASGVTPTEESPPPTNAWLALNQLVPIELLRTMEGNITSVSPVIRFQSVGFHDESPIRTRVEIVLDGGQRPPRIRAYKRLDQAELGIPRIPLGVERENAELPSVGEIDLTGNGSRKRPPG